MRFTGVLFWICAMQTNPLFKSYMFADLTLGIVQSTLLYFGLRRARKAY
jgi:hypothetical protein